MRRPLPKVLRSRAGVDRILLDWEDDGPVRFCNLIVPHGINANGIYPRERTFTQNRQSQSITNLLSEIMARTNKREPLRRGAGKRNAWFSWMSDE